MSLTWEFQAAPTNIVDGDTIDVDVDLGFDINRGDQRLRFANIDTAEIHGQPKDSDEYEAGMTHRSYVQSWLDEATAEWDDPWPLLVETEIVTGKYGRYIAVRIERKCDGRDLLADLVAEYPDVEDN